jgi:hypothetical protein
MMITVSEKIFEEYCQQNRIYFNKINTESNSAKKSPDYEIIVNSQKIIVEIKQIDPNPNDKKNEERLRLTGTGGTFGGKIGKRISQKITSAMPQLKVRAKNKYPSLLVIYNNISFTDEYVQPDEVMCGMYGRHVVYLPFGSNKKDEIIDQDFGPTRRLTPDANTTLSALAIIRKEKNDIKLDIFSNKYANIPLSNNVLPNSDYFELDKKEKGYFYTWKKVN